MRRFVYNDEEYEVKVTVDVSEEMFHQMRTAKMDMSEAVKKLVNFTMNKEKFEHERK